MKEKLFTRNFTLLILGQVSSLIGNYTLRFALSMYVLEQTGSASVFGGMLALALLPTVLLSPFGGILADRVNRRSIMVVLDSLSGAAVLLSAIAMGWGQDLFVIGTLLVVLSVLGAFESPTVQACVPQMLSGENRIRGNAVVSQVASVASLITPFLGSLFYTAFGLMPVFYGAGICFVVTALLECLIRIDGVTAAEGMGAGAIIRKDLAESWHFLTRVQPDVLRLLLLASVVSLFVAGVSVVGFPYLVRTVLGLSARHYGAAESLMGAASILGSLCVVIGVKKLRLPHLAVVLVSFGICLLPCGLAFLVSMSALGRYGILLVMFSLCQAGCSFFSTYAISVIQERTPEEMMGKVMSFVFTLSMCAQPVGQILYGALFDRFSRQVFWVLLPSGLAVCVTGLLSVRFFRRMES